MKAHDCVNQNDTTSSSVENKRFSSALQNPLYRQVPRRQKRVGIDKRFQSMFEGKNFKLNYQMDKRGRAVNTTSDGSLQRLYHMSDVENPCAQELIGNCFNNSAISSDSHVKTTSEESQNQANLQGSSQSRSGLSKSEKNELHNLEVDYLRGEGQFAADESSSDSSSDNEDLLENMEDQTMHEWGEMDRDAAFTEATTRRLALCNMDWDRLSACDLMVLFHSFLPSGGSLKCVTIYPSEFGQKRLAEEELNGPKELVENNSSLLTEEFRNCDAGSDDEDSNGVNMEKLRKYQLNRLKYYYAILEFDSKETADKVYSECDGMEYESSATRIDLRFVPDDMIFDNDPHDKWNSVPDLTKYIPRFFTTTALQQMKVNLTWDETDPRRKELTDKFFNKKESVDDEDIRAYLASSESDSEVEASEATVTLADEEKKDSLLKYKALLQSMEEVQAKKKDKDVEMEITWGCDLKKQSTNLVKKKQQEVEVTKMTPWEEMLAKRREKRKLRKLDRDVQASASETDEDDCESNAHRSPYRKKNFLHDYQHPLSDGDVEIGLEDPAFKHERQISESKNRSIKDRNTRKSKEEEGKINELAELDLLLMSAKHDKHHFSLQKILETEKSPKKKGNLRKRKITAISSEDNFRVNVEDDRFTAMYSSHQFSVDPSDPNFKKTKSMKAFSSEKQKRRMLNLNTKVDVGDKVEACATGLLDQDSFSSSTNKSELADLVKSIKGKTRKLKSAASLHK